MWECAVLYKLLVDSHFLFAFHFFLFWPEPQWQYCACSWLKSILEWLHALCVYSLTHSLTRSLALTLAHPLSLSHSLTLSLSHSLTLTLSLSHSLTLSRTHTQWYHHVPDIYGLNPTHRFKRYWNNGRLWNQYRTAITGATCARLHPVCRGFQPQICKHIYPAVNMFGFNLWENLINQMHWHSEARAAPLPFWGLTLGPHSRQVPAARQPFTVKHILLSI